jgi:cob(I)alamin adenosyltransferase
MADKIHTHLARMQNKMDTLKDQRMMEKYGTVEKAEEILGELEGHWRDVQSVIRDMLPDLASQ